MKHIVLTAVALGAAFSAGIARAEDAAVAPDTSVMATPTPTPDATTPAVKAAAKPKPKPAAQVAAKPAGKPAALPWVGTWTGTVQQVGRAQGYPIEITLTAKGGDTSYPGQNCAGKLVKLGSNSDYATFVETITSGKFDPASKAGCLDGSLTIERSADGAVMSWVTGYGGKAIVAYGALMPKAK